MMSKDKQNPAFNIWEGVYPNFKEAEMFRVGSGFSGATYSKRSMEAAKDCQMALRSNKPIPIFHSNEAFTFLLRWG